MLEYAKKRGSDERYSKGRKSQYIPESGDMDVDTEDVSLTESGACGAFVHGLEDEYAEVRHAAVNSICELSMHTQEYALRALDFLIDMFNDEVESVRLNSITSISKVASRHPLSLDKEQLQITTLVLQDANDDIREAAHRMLGMLHLSSAEGILVLTEALIRNMNRYPIDRPSVYRCFRDLGRRHPEFIESLTPNLLKLDVRYLAQEINQDDPIHIAHMIMIWNASSMKPEIAQRLPKYATKHHLYLRDKFPDCFPEQLDISSLISPTEISLGALNGPAAAAEHTSLVDPFHFLKSAVESLLDARELVEQGSLDEAARLLQAHSRYE
ncbi:Integrator complex subunit 4 [Quaeritorhiza haematococci]|nr:Integrator complex subunit 4 [Quaeritorhiza haematococci]